MSFTLTTSGAILRKAGTGVSTHISISGVGLAEWSDEAEAHIFAQTRKDWVADYADVDTNAKPILSEVASALAAKHAIVYDTTNYKNNTEWLNKLNMLDDIATKGLAILSQQANKDAISS